MVYSLCVYTVSVFAACVVKYKTKIDRLAVAVIIYTLCTPVGYEKAQSVLVMLLYGVTDVPLDEARLLSVCGVLTSAYATLRKQNQNRAPV